jgi:DNA-binding FrmR family transcriptional regulator
MIGEERGCEEILPQIASIRQAANGLAGELLQAHIGQCVRSSMEAGDEEHAMEQIQGVVRGVLKYT